MKPTSTKKIDSAGLQKAVTTLAVAAGLAGWAVLAGPHQSAATTTMTVASAAQVTASAPAAVAVAAAPAASVAAAPVAAAPASTAALRVVTAPAPVTMTQSSR